MGEVADGAKRIHPQARWFRHWALPLAASLLVAERGRRRYEVGMVCALRRCDMIEWVWERVVSRNWCKVDKSKYQWLYSTSEG